MELDLFGRIWQVSLEQRVGEQTSHSFQNKLEILTTQKT